MQNPTESNFLTIFDASEQIASGQIPPRAPIETCFRQIERLNPTLNAFLEVADEPEGKVDGMEEKLSLSGIPIAIKDLIDVRGYPTTAGSPKFFGHEPTSQDAVAVAKLRATGAKFTGKTQTHEIALGITGINAHFGPVRNPWDTSRITGGSSSGSAAAVAAGMSLAALGSDTGGSIRIPSALCGTVGLKPTFGLVSRRGVVPLSWNLDHVGPITRSVRDAALILNVIAGYDPLDLGAVDVPMQDYTARIEAGVRGRKIALATGPFIEECDSEVLAAVRAAANVFAELGGQVFEVEPPDLRQAAQANGTMVIADAAAFHHERLAEHPDWYGTDVRERLEKGRSVTSTEYSLARRTQSEMKRAYELFFADYDVLLLPSTAVTAAPIEGLDSAAFAPKLTRFTAPFNLTGLPALSLPCGFSSEGLPIGLQIVGKAWGEVKVLQAGYAYERATEWHNRRPAL